MERVDLPDFRKLVSTAGRSQLGRLPASCFLGVDSGSCSTKIFAILRGDAYYGEISLTHGRSGNDETPRRIMSSLRALLTKASPSQCILVTNLKSSHENRLRSALKDSLPSVQILMPGLDSRLAPVFALKDRTLWEKRENFWTLDIGLHETRLTKIVVRGGELPLEIGATDSSSLEFSARLLDRSMLGVLEEFGLIADVEKTFQNPEGKDYRNAVGLKHRVSSGQEVIAKAGDFSSAKSSHGKEVKIPPKDFERNLFNSKEWQSFRKTMLSKIREQEASEKEISSLILQGGSLRVPAVRRRLSQELSSAQILETVAPDPAYTAAVGMALYAFFIVQEEDVQGQQDRASLRQESTTGREERKLGPTTSTSLTQQLLLRTAGDLVPIFDPSRVETSGGGQAAEVSIRCAPLPSYLVVDGQASLELQLFSQSMSANPRIDGSCPQFLARRRVRIPAGEGFILSFQLVESFPLSLQLRVLKEDGEVFLDEAWNLIQQPLRS